jgi:hypothetical protein
MALVIGTDGLITLGRQATGDGVITTDISTTVTTGIITDGGGKSGNVIETHEPFSGLNDASAHDRCRRKLCQ